VAKRNKIEVIVAPYEADAELAYLSRSGYVDYVMTIDSDLMPYGAKTILYGLDVETGSVNLVQD
jgi:exonuclease-1